MLSEHFKAVKKSLKLFFFTPVKKESEGMCYHEQRLEQHLRLVNKKIKYHGNSSIQK